MSRTDKKAREELLLRRVKQQANRARSLVAGTIAVRLLWADSLGAKSMSIFVDTPDVRVLVDPGASGMQPSFPLDEERRDAFKMAAFEMILSWAKAADVVVVTHYHHDHYADPSEFPLIYKAKQLLVKDPNQWINHSQWHRAREFFEGLAKQYGNAGDAPSTQPPGRVAEHRFEDEHPVAHSRDFGDYNDRRRQILERGAKRLAGLREIWEEQPWVQEGAFGSVRVRFADGKSFRFGDTTLRFTQPLFHGVEFATVGWVIALVVQREGKKLVYTSDLQGPTLEDYAEWLIAERPDILVLDGPPTYLFGQLVNRINMQRAIDNAIRIARELPDTIVIYDHHLPRDVRFRERMRPLYEFLDKFDRAPFLTVAEWCGMPTVAEELSRSE